MIGKRVLAAGALAMMFAAPASAGVIYNTLLPIGSPNAGSTRIIQPGFNNYVNIPPGQQQGVLSGGGPTAVSFNLATTTTITQIALDLNANNPNDGGSVLVFIVPDAQNTGLPTLPSHTGSGNTFAFTGAPIATILDSALTACGATELCTGSGQNFGQVNLSVSATLPAGEYWLGLENIPGGGNTTATAKLAKLQGTLSGGIGNAGQLDFNQSPIVGTPGIPNTYSAADGGPLVYGVMIATPEPASLAILGAAMAGLGVMRRRRRS